MNKSMLKKAAIFGLAGVMAVAAGCGSNKDAGNANNNEAKIALLTTTTGGAAAYGESIKAGAELAVSEINADANNV
ncbi:MAG: branched-chain amino acid ABC transporter substrate-binding protein, partial [Veillonella sp.]|nr:branched-chain amino acid ABC transporter substrate-binding protein [Veillonella sp.]